MEQGKAKQGKYKTTNWTSYNAALKARGSLTVWLDRDMQWRAEPTGRRGRQPIFSEAAIQFCLSIKCLFGLPLRQSLGLAQSLLQMGQLDRPVPDFSTVCRRQARLQVQLSYRPSTVEWLSPPQPGGDQDALLQATRRAVDGTQLCASGGGTACARCAAESLLAPGHARDGRRGIAPPGVRGHSSTLGFAQQSPSTSI